MPELPEVETVRRGLEPALAGKRIAGVVLNGRGLRVPFTPGFKARAEGRAVQTLFRRGKYLLAFLSGGEALVLHLGMSGRVQILAPGQAYQPAKHDHLVFEMEDGGRIVFNDARRFGMAYLISAKNWEKEKPFSVMGPEPLGNDFNGLALAQRLKGRTTSIKAALLDQTIVAGVGNIYACEALYESGIDPRAAAGRIKKDRLEVLAAAIKNVLLKAIKSGGSSLRDHRQTDGSPGYFQHHFAVYDRAGQACPDCSCDVARTQGIKRIVQGGRSTFYCPRRQKR